MTATVAPTSPTGLSRVVTHLDVALCLLFIAGGSFMWWALTWGPSQWHSGPSLAFVAGLGLAWPVIGALWLVYALLLTNHCTRVVGYWLGVVLSLYFTVSLLNATIGGRLTSVFALVLVIFATAGQVSAAIRSMVTAERNR